MWYNLAPGKLSIWISSSLNYGILERLESPMITTGLMTFRFHSFTLRLVLGCLRGSNLVCLGSTGSTCDCEISSEWFDDAAQSVSTEVLCLVVGDASQWATASVTGNNPPPPVKVTSGLES